MWVLNKLRFFWLWAINRQRDSWRKGEIRFKIIAPTKAIIIILIIVVIS